MDAMEEDQPFELEARYIASADEHKSLHINHKPSELYRPVLQAYAGNYVSHARVDRLLFIARSKQGTAFGEDALRLALEELSQVYYRQRNSPDPCAILYLRSLALQSDDTQRYQEVALKFGGKTANRYVPNAKALHGQYSDNVFPKPSVYFLYMLQGADRSERAQSSSAP